MQASSLSLSAPIGRVCGGGAAVAAEVDVPVVVAVAESALSSPPLSFLFPASIWGGGRSLAFA